MRALLCALLAAHAGCTTIECGEGTFSDGDKCVGYDPNDKTPPTVTLDPPGGRTRLPIPAVVALTADEPARIFYTIDGTDPDATQLGETSPAAVLGVKQGTTLKYFAVDRAGNRSDLVTTTFDSDTHPPATVGNLVLSLTGAQPTVSWTNPSDPDFAGVVVARVVDAVDLDPTPGMVYTAGMALSPSLQIVSAGKVSLFADTGRPAGPVRYAVWTVDDIGNYSAPITVRDEIPLGSMTAQLTFTAANQTLTPTQSPANLDLTGSTATLAGTTMTMTLSVKNNTTRYFQNLKAEVTGVTGASFGSADGSADGFAFRSLGPELLAPSATVTRSMVFTGVAAGSTVTINLTFAHHPSLLSTAGRNLQNAHLVDLGSGQVTPFLVTTSRGSNDRANGRVRPPLFVGGRYLDIPTTHGSIERWDLVTRKFVFGAKLSQDDVERVNIQGIYATPTATYALVKYGGKRRIAAAELVKLDEGLHVVARLPLPNDDRGFTRPAFSPDFSVMAIPLQAGVALIDLVKFEQLDATPSTPFSIDMIEPGFPLTDGIRAVQFFNGASGLVVLARRNGRAAVIRRVADDYTVTPFQDGNTTAKCHSLVTAPDGKIWMALASGLRVFDPATGNISAIGYGSQPNGMAVVDGKLWVIREDRVTLDQISTAGAVQRTITLPANTGAYGHWLETAR